eukprot:5021244-Ditylum_brightwellii.AAC.1
MRSAAALEMHTKGAGSRGCPVIACLIKAGFLFYNKVGQLKKAPYSSETQAVISSSAKFGGIKFSTLTSLSNNALPLDIGLF